MTNILDGYISKQKAAEQLGCSVRTLDRYENVPDGLPSVKVGGRAYYRIEALRDFIAKRERHPNQRVAA